MSASMGEMELMSTAPLRANVAPTPTADAHDGHQQRQAGGDQGAQHHDQHQGGDGDAEDLRDAEELGDVLGDFLAGQGRDAGGGEFRGDVLDLLPDLGVRPLMEVLNCTWAIAALPSSETNRMPWDASSWRLPGRKLRAPAASSSLVPASSCCLALRPGPPFAGPAAPRSRRRACRPRPSAVLRQRAGPCPAASSAADCSSCGLARCGLLLAVGEVCGGLCPAGPASRRDPPWPGHREGSPAWSARRKPRPCRPG